MLAFMDHRAAKPEPQRPRRSGNGRQPHYRMNRTAHALVAVAVALAAACGGEDLDPGDALAAALAASSAYDALDDLGALDDPDAAGSRDAFRAATVAALERAREANRTAPRATATAYRASLNAGELADRFGLAFGAALEARAEWESAESAVAAVIAQTIAELEDRIGFALPTHERAREAATLRRIIEGAGKKEIGLAELREDTGAKIETAEDLRHQAMSAYRIAAEAWRALTA